MSVTTDYPDWSPHVANASQIAATGVPLLTKSTRLYQQATNNVGHGATASSGILPVSQPGYEIIVTAQFAAGTAIPFVEIQLTWTDSTTGFVIATDSFYAPGATQLGGLPVRGHGPTKADELTIGVTNLDTVNTVNITVTALQNSRVYAHDVWRFANSSASGKTVPGFTLAGLPDDESVLGLITGGAIPASGSASWLGGIGHGGWVNWAGNTAGPAFASLFMTIFAQPVGVYGGGGIVLRQQLSQAAFTYQCKAPRAPLLFEVTNTATTTGTVSFLATVGP